MRTVTLAVVTAWLGYGQVNQPTVPTDLPSWEEDLRNLPVVRFFTSWFDGPALPAFDPLQAAGCPVTALDPIDDPAALQLEASDGADVVDTSDMVPAAARALDRFQSRVRAAGGTIVLKSAYRPSAYQQHLQNVWYKWMTELRTNSNPSCQVLRAQVQEEFTRHRLMETQHPVAVSDHTRGLAFDAAVFLPARSGRRRISLDGLARLAGLARPAIAADPVHFKFMGGTQVAAVRTVAVRTVAMRAVRVRAVRVRASAARRRRTRIA
ncbi:MAG TPA: hypothetical protein VG456_10665 [Candidatus Sulfopaludibacter sp.]|nr:hypothetical protein [Candidatus Sulfopaludibacter sp.]